MFSKRNTRRWLRMGLGAVFLMSLMMMDPVPVDATRSVARDTARRAWTALKRHGYRPSSEFQTGLLRRGGKKVVRMTLYRGTEYAFVAGGCADAHDVDVHLYDSNWRLIKRDEDRRPAAAVTFRPRYTGTYNVVVHMYDSTRDGAHYILLPGYR